MEEKVFFMPGDLVTLKQDIPNKPIMIVIKKETCSLKVAGDDKNVEYFRGIKCRWFTKDSKLQEAV